MNDKNARQSAPPPGAGSRSAKPKTVAAPGPSPVEVRAAVPGVTRRETLRTAMYGTVGLFFGSSLLGSGIMFWPYKLSGFGGRVLVPKKLSEIQVGDAPLKVREGKFYLSRLAEPEGLIALYWKCPHLGCTVPWEPAEGKFHCPCHGSIYETNGQNVGGPAPRPMDYMAIEVNGDQIVVDTGKITQRTTHDPKHVTKLS